MSFKRVRNIFGRNSNITEFLSGKDKGYSGRRVAGVRLAALAPISGTGGTLLTPGNGYKYHVFTSSGTFSITPPGDGNDITYLIVGGGGGGGGSVDAYAGAGGGAGGYVEGTLTVFGSFPLSITIGSASSPAGNGNPSTIADPGTTITAWGGGAGGTGSPSPPTQWIGTPGGSGGGATLNATAGTGDRQTGTPTSTGSSPPQGFPGFTYATLGGPGALSGGGGGAGFGGPVTTPSQTGGDGKAAFSGDSGIPPSYGTPGPTPGRWFAGGGAGDGGSGGAGGGGGPGSNGTANTGGGGGARWPTGAGRTGGSGIVIIKYLA